MLKNEPQAYSRMAEIDKHQTVGTKNVLLIKI